MTRQEFDRSKDPWTFFATVDPTTGDASYEYLEGWDWGAYILSITKDFPERFTVVVRNYAAKKQYYEARGIVGLPL